jgi:hypothetical protein
VKYALRTALPQAQQRSEAEVMVLQEALLEWRERASRLARWRVDAEREHLAGAAEQW